jgi:hypothetical protein
MRRHEVQQLHIEHGGLQPRRVPEDMGHQGDQVGWLRQQPLGNLDQPRRIRAGNETALSAPRREFASHGERREIRTRHRKVLAHIVIVLPVARVRRKEELDQMGIIVIL